MGDYIGDCHRGPSGMTVSIPDFPEWGLTPNGRSKTIEAAKMIRRQLAR